MGQGRSYTIAGEGRGVVASVAKGHAHIGLGDGKDGPILNYDIG